MDREQTWLMYDERSSTDQRLRKEFCRDCCVPIRTPGGYTVCSKSKEDFKTWPSLTQHPAGGAPPCPCLSKKDRVGVY